jgi:hypothetical protein
MIPRINRRRKLINSRHFGTKSRSDSLITSITQKDFHRDMFERQVKKADMRAVFTEYAWNMNWWDACGADPLSLEELLSLGVHRLNETPPDFVPGRDRRPIVPPMGGAHDVFATPMRGHYDAQHIPGVVKWWQ